MCWGIPIFKNPSEQLKTGYTHSELRFMTRKDLQLKNEMINLLRNENLDDPVSYPQRTMRIVGPAIMTLSDQRRYTECYLCLSTLLSKIKGGLDC